MKQSTLILLIIVLGAIFGTIALNMSTSGNDEYGNDTSVDEQGEHDETHIHADLAIILDGERVDLSGDEYQSNDTIARHAFLHLHENNPDVLHIHAKDQTLANFLESLGMRLSAECLTTRDGKEYCEDNDLEIFIDGEQYDSAFNTYIPSDLERILITNQADEQKILEEMESVTDKACIQSGTCPERGESTESCSSANGCPAPPRVEPLLPHTTTPEPAPEEVSEPVPEDAPEPTQPTPTATEEESVEEVIEGATY